MSKKAKTSGGGNMLLIAGLGVGALLLFGSKTSAQQPASAPDVPGADEAASIPDAPKILAVNSSGTESPTPTGIVSDEDGMQIARNASTGGGSQVSDSVEYDDSDEDSIPAVKQPVPTRLPSTGAGGKVVPPIVSTPLTPKEKAIIAGGKLTAALALKRPDLYKAIYIKKYGGKTAAGKRRALAAAILAIDAAVKTSQAVKNDGLVKAVKYPAHPQHTFIQTAGGMVSQAAAAKIAALQKAGITPSPAAQKVAARVSAVKGTKGRYKVNRPAAPSKAGAPSPTRKNRNTSKRR